MCTREGEGAGRQREKDADAHVVRDPQRGLAIHDEVDLDGVVGPVVVRDARVDRRDLVGKRHGLVRDEVLELARGGLPGEVLEVADAGVAPGEDEDDC